MVEAWCVRDLLCFHRITDKLTPKNMLWLLCATQMHNALQQTLFIFASLVAGFEFERAGGGVQPCAALNRCENRSGKRHPRFTVVLAS